MLETNQQSTIYKNSVSSDLNISGENLNFVYLKTKFKDFNPNFSKIIINLLTKDQGSASVPDSYSYFNLRIVDINGNLLAEKQRIIENYKDGDYKSKSFTIERDDETFSKIMCGDNVLQLVARSQYQAWKNFVKFGEIKFE